MKTGISFTQIVFILMLSNGLINHVIVIPLILDVAKRDSWLSVIFAGALYLLWTVLIYFVYKKTRQENLLLWVKKTYGSGIYLLIALLTAAYCFTNATVTLTDTVTWINLSFAPMTPLFVHTILFAVLCFMNAVLGIRSIAMTSSVLLPFVVILGFFVMATNFQHKDYSLLLPIMENGFGPVAKGMAYAGTGFAELIIFLLLKHHLSSTVPYIRLLLLAIAIVGLTIGPTIGAVIEFGPVVAANLRYPAYEEWRLANIGIYIEHLDFLSIYQWFSGAFTRISLSLFLITELFMIDNGRKRFWVLCGLFLCATAISIWPNSDISFYSLLSQYILPTLLSVALFLSIVLMLLTAFAERRGRYEES
ncbi:endospore germination permease [Brevibacillus reuszeri]|uniref:endospore germination permease n=1 Tax=Brevibacillus reuszeri TaxID=54915 RepID=UPI003D1FCEC0